MIDPNFEENVKKAFKGVKKDNNNLNSRIDGLEIFMREIKDKIDLVMEKINKIGSNIEKRAEKDLISHGKASISNGNGGVNNILTTSSQHPNNILTTTNNILTTTNNIEKLLISVTSRELSVLMAVYKLEEEKGSATTIGICDLLSLSQNNLRQYIMILAQKGFIYKKKLVGKSHFFVNKTFREQNIMDKLLKLQFGSDIQKTLFD